MNKVIKLTATLLLLVALVCLLPSCDLFSSLFDTSHDCEQYSVWKIENYPTKYKMGSKKLICNYCERKLRTAFVPVVSRGLSYKIIDGDVWITGIGTCTDTELVIPNEINGKSVVGIEEFAFKGNENIKSVIMPDTLREIGKSAFLMIPTLKDIIIGENLEKMGSNAFSNTNLISVYIPGSIKDLTGISSFSNCKNLERVVLGEGVERIEYAMFFYCESLEFLSLPSTLKDIRNAFYKCENLSVVDFRGNIGQYCELERGDNTSGSPEEYQTFYNAKILLCGNEFPKNIEIPAGTTKIATYAFFLMDITSVKIPDSVVSIGYGAFAGCKSLESVEFGKGLKTIDSNAFLTCESLKEIIIEDGIESIGHGAFRGCHAVEYVEIGEGLEVLRASTLEALLSLKEIKLPSTLKSYKYPLFSFNTQLKNVYYGGTVDQWFEFINSAAPYTCNEFNKVWVHCSDGEIYDNKRIE